MRDVFHEELDHIGRSLIEMTNLVDAAMRKATVALLGADLTLAEQVISEDAVIDQLHAETEQRALDLIARQQPVASDLRTIMTGMRMVGSLERMGDLALHVAKVARMRYPNEALPSEVRPIFAEMAQLAHELTEKAGEALAGHDTALAAELERDDDRMDALHRRLFTLVLADWQHGMESAIDVTLLGRYYERYADHAVSLARRVVQLVTGELPRSTPSASPIR